MHGANACGPVPRFEGPHRAVQACPHSKQHARLPQSMQDYTAEARRGRHLKRAFTSRQHLSRVRHRQYQAGVQASTTSDATIHLRRDETRASLLSNCTHAASGILGRRYRATEFPQAFALPCGAFSLADAPPTLLSRQACRSQHRI